MFRSDYQVSRANVEHKDTKDREHEKEKNNRSAFLFDLHNLIGCNRSRAIHCILYWYLSCIELSTAVCSPQTTRRLVPFWQPLVSTVPCPQLLVLVYKHKANTYTSLQVQLACFAGQSQVQNALATSLVGVPTTSHSRSTLCSASMVVRRFSLVRQVHVKRTIMKGTNARLSWKKRRVKPPLIWIMCKFC